MFQMICWQRSTHSARSILLTAPFSMSCQQMSNSPWIRAKSHCNHHPSQQWSRQKEKLIYILNLMRLDHLSQFLSFSLKCSQLQSLQKRHLSNRQNRPKLPQFSPQLGNMYNKAVKKKLITGQKRQKLCYNALMSTSPKRWQRRSV